MAEETQGATSPGSVELAESRCLSLEARVAGWITSLAKLCPGREDLVDELECHLWDEIDHRIGGGEAPNEAFEAAARRLGCHAAIASEFAKVSVVPLPWLPVRLAWAASVLLALAAILMLKPRFDRGGVDSLLAAHMGGVMLGYLASLMVGGLAA